MRKLGIVLAAGLFGATCMSCTSTQDPEGLASLPAAAETGLQGEVDTRPGGTVETLLSKLKAKPAQPSGFLDNSTEMTKHDRFPFHSVWVSEKWKEDRHSYTKLIIPEVDVSHLRSTEWWERHGGQDQQELIEDAIAIGKYWRDALIQVENNHADARPLEIVETAGEKTLSVEIAIVELIPNKVDQQIMGEVAGQFVPGGGLIASKSGGVIAFEMRIRDASTGEVLLKSADRENFKSGVVLDTVKLTSVYKGARLVIDDWVEQMVDLYRLPFDQIVKDSAPFELVAL